MSQYVDFLNLIVGEKLPEEQVLELLAVIPLQIEKARATLKRYENTTADLVLVEGELLNRLAAANVLDEVDTLQSAYADIIPRLAVLRKMSADLTTLATILMRQEMALKQARNAFAVGRANAQEAAAKAAQQKAAQDEQKQLDYERTRSKRAYEGDQDAIENWPDTWQEFEAMMEARNKASKDLQQKAAQDAQTAREAEDKARVLRVTEWLERLTQI